MHLSTHEFVALAVDWELTKFLETQFGNDFGAHEALYTSTKPFRSQRSSSTRHRREDGCREWGKRLSRSAASSPAGGGRLIPSDPLGRSSARPSAGLVKAPAAGHPLPDGGDRDFRRGRGHFASRQRLFRYVTVITCPTGTAISGMVISVIDKNLSSR